MAARYNIKLSESSINTLIVIISVFFGGGGTGFVVVIVSASKHEYENDTQTLSRRNQPYHLDMFFATRFCARLEDVSHGSI